jgi:hypothetical protein
VTIFEVNCMRKAVEQIDVVSLRSDGIITTTLLII